MTTLSDAIDAPAAPPVPLAATRPFYWSVRRELWEYRALYGAPLIAAGVVLFGFVVSALRLHDHFQAALKLDDASRSMLYAIPYNIVAIAVILTGLIVGLFYCLGALHNERRDRSILFWKSLPVSDLTSVLAKASIPMVALPLISLAVIIAAQMVILLVSLVIGLANGLSAAPLLAAPFQAPLVLPYGLIVLALWNAPVYGWLLLVSGWARRAAFLWAVLPPIGLCLLERIAFNTTYLSSALNERLFGGFTQAFNTSGSGRNPMSQTPQIDAARFVTNPDVWLGLAVAAAFLAAAVWQRRRREPI